MAPKDSPATKRTQEQRSATTRQRLIAAATDSLVENGYAYTSVVEVCARAQLTRGAFHHHYGGLAELFAAVLEHVYGLLLGGDDEAEPTSAGAFIRRVWARVSRPEFKAVIEIWLAARNDRELGEELAPAILKLSALFQPSANEAYRRFVGDDPEAVAFHHLVSETMIGLALGRATSPSGRPVAHEDLVIDHLVALSARVGAGKT